MSRRERRTVPVLCEQPQGTTGTPQRFGVGAGDVFGHEDQRPDQAEFRSRECVTGGSALSLPVNMVLRSSASQKSSAVWPKAITLAPRSCAIS